MILALVIFGAGAQQLIAQATKIGYVRVNDVLGLMPELAAEKVNLDTVGQQFVKDSVMPRLNYIQDEYQKKLKDYEMKVKKKLKELYLFIKII